MSTVVRQGVFVGFPNRDWQAVTHPQLLKAVESVREHFAEKAEDLRETILKDVSKGQPPLGIYLHPPVSIFPPTQKFEYCFLGLWQKGLVELLKHCFYPFLQIAVENLSLVIGDPVVWAYGHVHALLMQELEISHEPEPDKSRPGGKLLRVRLWIKAFFDPPNSPDPEMLKSIEGFEERLFRTNWRAPRCLWSFADPRILCDEAQDWERLDQEKTEQLLDVVASRFLRGVEMRLQEEARAASIGTATQGIPALAHKSQSVLAGSVDVLQQVSEAAPQSLAPSLNYRSLLKRAIWSALIHDPMATDLQVCRWIDDEGSAEAPDSKDLADRTLESAYRSGNPRKHNLESQIDKVRRDIKQSKAPSIQ